MPKPLARQRRVSCEEESRRGGAPASRLRVPGRRCCRSPSPWAPSPRSRARRSTWYVSLRRLAWIGFSSPRRIRLMKLLEGKRALVTGVANRWSIATGIARKLHEHGALVASDVSGRARQRRGRKARRGARQAPACECDVSNDASLADDAERARNDASASSTCSFIRSPIANKEDLAGKVFDTSRAGFSLALDVSSFSLDRAGPGAARIVQRRRVDHGAHISRRDARSFRTITSMGIAKAALEAVVRYLAFDLGDREIRVNAISAGPIKTASSRQVGGFSRILEVVPKVAPLRRNVTAGRHRQHGGLSRATCRRGHRRRAFRRCGLPRDGTVIDARRADDALAR